jgi:DNA adenine methylase
VESDVAKEDAVVPFLKWAGGKRWFVHRHSHLLPKTYNRYFEPFLGGGAVFFHLRPRQAVLADINPEIIAAYRAVKEQWVGLTKSLAWHQRAHDEDESYYYDVRERSPKKLVPRASRMIYLNRTCFNGIYRVNKQGCFNVPRGSKDAVLLDTDNFKAVAALLAGADLRVSDFEDIIDEADEDDLIFADPPYTVRHNLNGFIKYNEVLFSWADQERLAAALKRAARRGAKIVATNANHHSVRSLYNSWDFLTRPVSRFSQISADATSRRQFEELVVTANL